MQQPDNQLDVFFHKMPMGVALFSRDLVLRRFNPTWAAYISTYCQLEVEEGDKLFELLPQAKGVLHPLAEQALEGELAAADAVRIQGEQALFYWDVVFAPWLEEGEVTGILQVATDVTDRALARQLLEKRVKDRTRRLSALFDIMAIAAEPITTETLLERSLTRVLTAVHATAGMIHLLDDADTWLILAAHEGISAEMAQKLARIPADTGLAGGAVSQDEPLVVPDVAADWRTSNIVRQSKLHVYAGVPMNTRSRVVGVLGVFRESKRSFSKEDIALLDSVSDQIAVVAENARLRLENEQLLIVQERNRLARELHDAVTQSLYSLTLFAETSQRLLQAGKVDMAAEFMGRTGETAQEALREMRLLLYNLRPSALEELGLERALQQRLESVEKRAGIQTKLYFDKAAVLTPELEEALFQIVQEALNNALKHAAATEIEVHLTQQGNQLKLTVTDNGSGFDTVGSSEAGGGLGLTSMHERVDALKGQLTIESRPNVGTMIEVVADMAEIARQHPVADLFATLRQPTTPELRPAKRPRRSKK